MFQASFSGVSFDLHLASSVDSWCWTLTIHDLAYLSVKETQAQPLVPVRFASDSLTSHEPTTDAQLNSSFTSSFINILSVSDSENGNWAVRFPVLDVYTLVPSNLYECRSSPMTTFPTAPNPHLRGWSGSVCLLAAQANWYGDLIPRAIDSSRSGLPRAQPRPDSCSCLMESLRCLFLVRNTHTHQHDAREAAHKHKHV